MRKSRDTMRWKALITLSIVILPLIATLCIAIPGRIDAKNSSIMMHRVAKKAQQTTAGLAVSGVYTLKAIRIDGYRAHLSVLPNLGHPVLKFASVTIQGLQLSHPIQGDVTLTIGSTGDVSATGVAIKTSLFKDLQTALKSFTNKADLLILIAGGTVGHLVMKQVTLKIDTYLQVSTLEVPGLTITLN